MRIALITHQWPGARLGGIGVYTLNAARALAEAGHHVHVVTFAVSSEVRQGVPEGVVLHEVPDLAEQVHRGTLPGALAAAIHAGGQGVYRLAMGAILCARVRELHAQRPFDIVEGAEYEGLALPLIVSPLSGDVPVVTHLHSGSAIARRASIGAAAPGAEELLLEAMEFATVLGASAVCAPSEQVVRDTREGCPVERATVLPLPFYPVVEQAPKPIAPDAPIVFCGRLETVKGAHLLPDALNAFITQHPRARVRIVGPDTSTAPGGGSMRKWMDAHLKVPVEFVGEQSRAELAEELAAARFVIAPSLFDSYSYLCCEALAAGRPVIVSDNIGATEVVGDAGLRFKRGDSQALAAAMTRLYNDPALLEQLAQRACQRATTTLAAKATTPQRVSFYESTIAASARRQPLAEKLAPLPSQYTGPLVEALARLTMFLAGVPDPAVKTPGMRLAAIMQQLTTHAGHPAKILLYGAGRHTSRLLAEKHLWESAGHAVVGLIDDHPRFQSEPTHLGLPVESAAQLLARLPLHDRATALVLSTDTFQDQFWSQTTALRERGLKVFRLYD
jgi:glycosyltransferase involved in cell wall biosynthesis